MSWGAYAGIALGLLVLLAVACVLIARVGMRDALGVDLDD